MAFVFTGGEHDAEGDEARAAQEDATPAQEAAAQAAQREGGEGRSVLQDRGVRGTNAVHFVVSFTLSASGKQSRYFCPSSQRMLCDIFLRNTAPG